MTTKRSLKKPPCCTAATSRRYGGPWPRRPSRRRPGFVLLMTLVLIAIFALAMVGLARHSLRVAFEAIECQERVQRHWGRVSLVQSALGRAEVILSERDRQRLEIAQEVRLGGTRFVLVLGDEGAKVNLNHVYQRGGTAAIRKVTDELVGILPLRYQRNPPNAKAGDFKPYQSWGQVFDCRSLSNSETAVRTLMQAGAQVTCWGSGKLNVRRASQPSVETVCRIAGATEVASKLIDELALNPTTPVEELLSRFDLQDSQRQELSGWLSDHSTCYSLWITMVDNTRSRHEMHIAQVSGEDPADVVCFSW